MISILLIAVSLAMDAFAISISTGMCFPRFGLRQSLKLGCWFGAFQGMMPLLGWFLGTRVAEYIEAFDHWLAFGLLAFIGGRMIWESLHGDEEESCPTDLSARRLCILAIATSIDALAVGVSMAFMADVNILFSAAVICVVTFLLSVVGGMLGRYLGSLFQKWAEVAGGVVLIGIGIKILMEHLMG